MDETWYGSQKWRAKLNPGFEMLLDGSSIHQPKTTMCCIFSHYFSILIKFESKLWFPLKSIKRFRRLSHSLIPPTTPDETSSKRASRDKIPMQTPTLTDFPIRRIIGLGSIWFLVACTRLYKPLCRSVRWSVHLLVSPSIGWLVRRSVRRC